jgi:hypothetical protein
MKIKLLLLVLTLLCLNSYAQISFENNVVIDNRNATNYPRAVYAADIDGDGDNDILSASTEDSKIAWYKNDGQGNFGNQQLISLEAIGASSVFAIDIDGDSDMDVISASIGDNKIAWYENLDGQGTFGSEQIISTEANYTWSVVAMDIDGDGDKDVVSASGLIDEGKVAWYENLDGLGSFGAQNIINPNMNGARSVYVADIDNDGDMDVLSASTTSRELLWYENLDSQGQFGLKQNIDNLSFYSVKAADIDNDGDMDVLTVSTSSGNGTVAWYENLDGQGNFGTRKIIISGTNNTLDVFAADIDGDGDLDVISGLFSDQDPAIEWYENMDGSGNFGPANQVQTSSGYATSIFVSDINNDGNLDIISASEDRIGFNKNLDGNGNFGTHQWFTYNVDEPRSVEVADIDGDGNLDVLSTSYLDGEVAWYKNLYGYGVFGTQKTISQKNFGANKVVARDIDGDGDLDVVFASDFHVAWQENLDGNGTFGERKIIIERVSSTFFDVASEDIDGDGDRDVITVAFIGDRINWFENLDGQGNFGPEQTVYEEFGFAPVFINVVDVNNDGKLDVVSASLKDGEANWFENLGGGNFGIPHLITSSYNNNIDIINSVDLDGDNDLDVIITKRIDDKIVWFENLDGFGNFGSEKLIASNLNTPRGIHSVDMDNDGDFDVISVSYYGNMIAWYENLDGLGNFGPQNIILANAGGPHTATSGDLDKDGDIDVVVSLNRDKEIRWFKNSLILGVNETATLNFSFYPNPSSSILYITLGKPIKQIEVYNNLGQMVTKNIEVLNDGNSDLNVSKLAPGVYFIKIKTNDGEIGVERFIKV